MLTAPVGGQDLIRLPGMWQQVKNQDVPALLKTMEENEVDALIIGSE